MNIADAKITIFGGTGFIGRYVVHELAKTGAAIRVFCRNPQRGASLKSSGYVGQINVEKGSILNRDDVTKAVKGADIVINLTGILFEGGNQKFSAIHAQGAERLAKSAKEAGVTRFIHISALGVDKAVKSKYARTKLNGEQAVMAAFPEATILRPSVVFGAEDNFLNMFAKMAAFTPFLPLIGGGKAKFSPVYAGDVARAICRILNSKTSHGKIYELGGGIEYSLRQIIELVMKETASKRLLLPIPFGLAGLIGAVMEILPFPLLTYDQVQLLRYDNLPDGSKPGLAELGIKPTALDVTAHEYLARYRRGGEFASQKC